jgi:uncharacterized membrane protein (UPF0127 family)
MFVTINKEIFKVKICKTKSETQRGMMGREFIGFDGMLFFMGKGEHSFWMLNCIIPLDIIFIDENHEITKIYHNCEPCEYELCQSYEGSGTYVLEIEGGRCKDENIEEGDICKFLIKV